MSPDASTGEGPTSSEILSHKIELLLDVVRQSDGSMFGYQDVKEGLEEQGVSLSRTRWHYLKNGGSPTRQPDEILEALASFFGVPADYLLHDEGEAPDRIQKELELLKSMRRARVSEFATRTLAGVDDETLQVIRELIDEAGEEE